MRFIVFILVLCALACEPRVTTTTTQLPPRSAPERDSLSMTRYSFAYDFRSAAEFDLSDGTKCVYAAGTETAFVTCNWKGAK